MLVSRVPLCNGDVEGSAIGGRASGRHRRRREAETVKDVGKPFHGNGIGNPAVRPPSVIFDNHNQSAGTEPEEKIGQYGTWVWHEVERVGEKQSVQLPDPSSWELKRTDEISSDGNDVDI